MKSRELIPSETNDYIDERRSMDFINILYSEIRALPEEMVRILD